MMNEQEAKATTKRLRGSISALIASEKTPMVQPEQEAVVNDALAMAEGLFVNIARIADALDALAKKP